MEKKQSKLSKLTMDQLNDTLKKVFIGEGNGPGTGANAFELAFYSAYIKNPLFLKTEIKEKTPMEEKLSQLSHYIKRTVYIKETTDLEMDPQDAGGHRVIHCHNLIILGDEQKLPKGFSLEEDELITSHSAPAVYDIMTHGTYLPENTEKAQALYEESYGEKLRPVPYPPEKGSALYDRYQSYFSRNNPEDRSWEERAKMHYNRNFMENYFYARHYFEIGERYNPERLTDSQEIWAQYFYGDSPKERLDKKLHSRRTTKTLEKTKLLRKHAQDLMRAELLPAQSLSADHAHKIKNDLRGIADEIEMIEYRTAMEHESLYKQQGKETIEKSKKLYTDENAEAWKRQLEDEVKKYVSGKGWHQNLNMQKVNTKNVKFPPVVNKGLKNIFKKK